MLWQSIIDACQQAGEEGCETIELSDIVAVDFPDHAAKAKPAWTWHRV